ncbi:acyl-[acyl-carrier-protein] thioesterase [Mycobacteroides salmoniphilum]|uniref:Acyl-ACP thioesterase n=1 Tax=Mycobacteroides salmoniphilum TaxID=404941 RepID=A0A4R8SH13_9MYCO|nr:acyl-[acyl-carrier-protein] thioesterase [Mycobacteroides salmoniphilum]TDZ96102.1 Acyl-ACP thioesterase [Mycobacteroides salmoniphilum]TEA05199.1 Acyl-ACP thioesterase [Mycobacteroides salmoniphilum]
MCDDRGVSTEPSTGLDKDMMPVPHAHPHVYEGRWPVRIADVDSGGRLRLDGAARHIQDIGQDHLRGVEAEKTHPHWVVRRTMIDVIKPIEFREALWLRRWCSATSNRWCQMRVRLDGRDGGLVESEAFWIHVSRETQGPARIEDDFLATVASTTDVDRLRWKPYNKPGSRDTATDIRDFPVRFTDMDLFDHMNNSVYWSIVEDHLSRHPELLSAPYRVSIEHDSAVALGDKLEIITNVYEDGTAFGVPGRSVTTLTYVVGDEVKALASIFAR